MWGGCEARREALHGFLTDATYERTTMKICMRVALALLAALELAACGTQEACPAPPVRPNIDTINTCQRFVWSGNPTRGYMRHGEMQFVTQDDLVAELEALASEDDGVALSGVAPGVADAIRQTATKAESTHAALVGGSVTYAELTIEYLWHLPVDVETACKRAGVQMPT